MAGALLMRMTVWAAILLVLASGCGGSDGGDSNTSVPPADAETDSFALTPGAVAPEGIIPPQPLVLPLEAPVVEPAPPAELPEDDLLQRTDGTLLVPPRREPRQSGGGGSTLAGGREVFVDVTAPVAAGEWYLFGFEYVAGGADDYQQGEFAPGARLLPPGL